MARRPKQRNLKFTFSFVEDQDEAMEKFCEAVKVILFMGVEKTDENSDTSTLKKAEGL